MGAVVVPGQAFDQAVTDFKARFALNPDLVTDGQFQFTNSLHRAVVRTVEAEFASVGAVDPGLQTAFDNFTLSGK